MPHTILSVDPEAAARCARNEVLRRAGFEVIEAVSGADALKLASEQQPALVVLAVELPDIDGFAVCKRLKADPLTASIPVLHISSRGECHRGYPESLESGANAYLQEPIEPPVLNAVAAALIRSCPVSEAASITLQSLLASEERFRTLFEAMTEGFALCEIICDEAGKPRDFRYLAVNRAFERQTGLKAGDILGRALLELFPQAEPVWIERYGKVALTGEPARFEAWFSPLEKWFEVSVFRTEPGRFGVVFADVTERKRAEEERQRLAGELADRVGELQAILDAAPVAIWIAHDPQCLRITGNAYADQIVMQTERGANVSRSAPPGDAAVSYKVFRKGVELRPEELPNQVAAATGRPLPEGEFEMVFPDGRTVYMLLGAVPLFDAEGRVRGSVSAGADVTQLRRTEEALRKERAALEAMAVFPEQNPSPVLRVGDDGVLLYANPSSSVLMAEWKCEAGQTIPDDLRHAIEEALAQDAPAEFDVRIGGRDYSFLIAPVAGCRYANLYGRDLTQRNRLADQLRERIEELETVMEVAPFAIWVAHDPQCQEITGNRMAARFYEAGAGENLSANVTAVRRFFQGGRELEPSELPMQEAAARGVDIRNSELDVLLPSGRQMNMLGNASPLRDRTGEVRGCVGTFLDITERKRAEEALRQSEERYRMLFNTLIEGFCIIEVIFEDGVRPVDYRFLEINPAFETQTGLKNARGRLMRDLAPDIEAHWFEIYGRVALTGQPARFVNEAKALNRWYDVSAYRVGGSESRKVAILFNDITERKRAEESLADAIQRLNAHMDNSPLAVIEFDRQFRVTRWSKEAHRVFGWSAEEILGRATAEMRWVHEDDVEAVRQVSQDMLEGKRPRNLSVNRNYCKDGSVVECEWYNSAIYDADGKLTSILSQVLDVTDRKRSEERLRQAQKLESLGVLAGGVAHDFNNLLVGVIGNASLAQDMLSPDHPAVELMEEVVKTGEQAAHLTRQMLAYSGKGKFLVEPLDLSSLIPDMSGLVRPTIPKKIALHLDLKEDLPPIEADRGQIQQVFMNLTLNAAEAIGGQDGLIAVKTGIENVDAQYVRRHPEAEEIQPGRYVYLEVSDSGCGMDEATRARIFDPFFTTKFTGRGLGLAAVAGIVRGHKGAIAVQSSPGEGSCFRVLFPAAERAAVERPITTRAATPKGAGLVLVVDDEPMVREMAKKALERYGYTILLADSGQMATDVLRSHPGDIALVILDLSMPGMSGEEVLPELRKIRPAVKVLVSSGYSEAETMVLFKGQQVSGFIQKPYTFKVLAEKVKGCIGQLAPARG